MTTTGVDRVDPPYRDATLPTDARVRDLLGRMTVEEKVAQLGSAWVFQLADGERLSPDRAAALMRNGLGQVTRISGASDLDAPAAARLANEIQTYLLEETRLGIPAIVHEEICSGLMARGSTVFPQAIGVASTWEPSLAEELAGIVRTRMRSLGAHQGLSPVLDVSRDPRWGRTEESFGEDPHLVARMGVAFVRGLQGDDLRDGVVATAKHFVGYGGSEGGLNWAPAHIPPRELRDVYLHPFEAVVRTAGVRSVMNAYVEIDGVPCTADRDLLTGLLRDDWGFDGFVVSDYFSVRQLAEYHRLAGDAASAAALALTAGIDSELPAGDCYGAPLLEALEAGLVDEETLDTAVRRVLDAKFELGLFEQPLVDVERAGGDGGAQRTLARKIAEKSLVLLKNDGVLPLAAGRRVAVIGPNADVARHLFGDYSLPAHIESLREMFESGRNVFGIAEADGFDAEAGTVDAETVLGALAARLPGDVRFAQGCELNGTSRSGFDEAVELAAASDVAVLVLGDKAGLTDECTSGESRDRSSLDLPGVQEQLARAVIATGTPVVLVLVVGRPAGSAWLHERCAAVLLAWLPGEEGAGAIADALTGATSPGGKLPISFPRSAGHVPTYYAHKISGGRSHWKGDYVDGPTAPLYPFGHGLAYTTFELTDVRVEQAEVPWNGTIQVRARLANTGPRAADEVVQLYVRDVDASLTRPVLELKGFVRVELAPGASTGVAFELSPGQLGFAGRDLAYVVEPGAFDVFVGTSSASPVEAGTVTVVADSAGPPAKTFDGVVRVG